MTTDRISSAYTYFDANGNFREVTLNRRWNFGPCSSAKHYNVDAQYIETCCLAPGNHTLTCDTKEEALGWTYAFLEIKGRRYCDDFITYKAMRRISIEGKLNAIR